MRSLDHGWRYQDAYHWYNFSNCRSIMLLPGWQHPSLWLTILPRVAFLPSSVRQWLPASDLWDCSGNPIPSGQSWRLSSWTLDVYDVLVCVFFRKRNYEERHVLYLLNNSKSIHRKISNNGIGCKDWVAKFLNLGPAFHHTSGVGGGIIQNTAGEVTLNFGVLESKIANDVWWCFSHGLPVFSVGSWMCFHQILATLKPGRWKYAEHDDLRTDAHASSLTTRFVTWHHERCCLLLCQHENTREVSKTYGCYGALSHGLFRGSVIFSCFSQV